jgi:hypothetical protein
LVKQCGGLVRDGPFSLRDPVHKTVRLSREHRDLNVELGDVTLLRECAAGERLGALERAERVIES